MEMTGMSLCRASTSFSVGLGLWLLNNTSLGAHPPQLGLFCAEARSATLHLPHNTHVAGVFIRANLAVVTSTFRKKKKYTQRCRFSTNALCLDAYVPVCPTANLVLNATLEWNIHSKPDLSPCSTPFKSHFLCYKCDMVSVLLKACQML